MKGVARVVEPVNGSYGAEGLHIGHVRWTICAMLFAATSINYMDRQVISLLKTDAYSIASASLR